MPTKNEYAQSCQQQAEMHYSVSVSQDSCCVSCACLKAIPVCNAERIAQSTLLHFLAYSQLTATTDTSTVCALFTEGSAMLMSASSRSASHSCLTHLCSYMCNVSMSCIISNLF